MERRIYHKTDTHWNDEGAFIAYRQIAEQLARRDPSIKVLSRADFEPRIIESRRAGDLARMLGVDDRFEEERTILAPRRPRRARQVWPGELISKKAEAYGWSQERTPRVMEVRDVSLPRLVAVHDSFLIQIIPFLSEHFSRSVYLSHTFEPEVIAAEKPDIVIDEVVERILSQPMPQNPPVVANFRRRP